MTDRDLKAERRASMTKRRENTCVHFTGTQHHVCKAGVRYNERGDGSPARPFLPLPCFADSTNAPTCAARRLPTPEEVAAEVDAREGAIESFLDKLRRGECATCGASVEPRKQVGRCIYAACGHRIGQGTITPARARGTR